MDIKELLLVVISWIPIPKMLDELLAESNENLDKIIMLCTDKTIKETSITTPENIMMNISPLEYFKNKFAII